MSIRRLRWEKVEKEDEVNEDEKMGGNEGKGIDVEKEVRKGKR